MDQHLSYYSLTTRRTLKWWKKIFWRFVDISIVNSWIIFRQNFPDTSIKSHREFRIKLAEELVQPLLDLQANPVTLVGEKRLVGKHFAYKSPKRGRCSVCSHKIVTSTKKRKDTKTQNFCKKFGVFLCVGTCFESYCTTPVQHTGKFLFVIVLSHEAIVFYLKHEVTLIHEVIVFYLIHKFIVFYLGYCILLDTRDCVLLLDTTVVLLRCSLLTYYYLIHQRSLLMFYLICHHSGFSYLIHQSLFVLELELCSRSQCYCQIRESCSSVHQYCN